MFSADTGLVLDVSSSVGSPWWSPGHRYRQDDPARRPARRGARPRARRPGGGRPRARRRPPARGSTTGPRRQRRGTRRVTLVDLVRQALRMRPDRLVVGEVRGAEVRELLAALNTGHEAGQDMNRAQQPEGRPRGARCPRRSLARGGSRAARQRRAGGSTCGGLRWDAPSSPCRCWTDLAVSVRGAGSPVCHGGARPGLATAGDAAGRGTVTPVPLMLALLAAAAVFLWPPARGVGAAALLASRSRHVAAGRGREPRLRDRVLGRAFRPGNGR